jgi:hypothetical protein
MDMNLEADAFRSVCASAENTRSRINGLDFEKAERAQPV